MVILQKKKQILLQFCLYNKHMHLLLMRKFGGIGTGMIDHYYTNNHQGIFKFTINHFFPCPTK